MSKNKVLVGGIVLPQDKCMKNKEKILLTWCFFCVYSETNDLTIFCKRENT